MQEIFRARLNLPDGKLGAIAAVHTFGDYLIFHPHLHVLAADGLFTPDGRFHCMPAADLAPATMSGFARRDIPLRADHACCCYRRAASSLCPKSVWIIFLIFTLTECIENFKSGPFPLPNTMMIYYSMPRLNFLRFLSVRATVCLFAISGAVASASNESAPFQLDLRLSLAEWADAAGVPLGDAQPTLIAGPLGVANLVAYGLGLDPMVGDPKDLPAIALDPINTNLLVYTYTLNRDSVGVSMIIEQSQDFVSWQEIVPVSDVLVEELSEGVERRVVRIERDLEKPAGFFRIRVEESP